MAHIAYFLKSKIHLKKISVMTATHSCKAMILLTSVPSETSILSKNSIYKFIPTIIKKNLWIVFDVFMKNRSYNHDHVIKF